jgi:hypothetical protein
MTKTEHLQFLVLMIPTLLILAVAAICMADLAFPAPSAPEAYAVAVADPRLPAEPFRDDRPAQ